MKITDFENRRSFKSIWLNSQFREEVRHPAELPLMAPTLRLSLWEMNMCFNVWFNVWMKET